MTALQTQRMAPPRARARADIRSVLVHVEPTDEAAPRLRAAAELARDCGATLLGVGVQKSPRLDMAEPYAVGVGPGLRELEAAVELALARAEQMFRAAADGLASDWLALQDVPAPTLARLSRAADLIVAGGAPLGLADAFRSADTADLVLMSGRPVLVAPPHGGRLVADSIVVAWKDSRESRRAVADSLPFLKAAREVRVVEVCAGGDAYALAELHTFEVVENLRRHGVKAEAKAIIAPPESVVLELNQQARAIDADLIVAGGYGHSRLGEWLLGGATRELLLAPERFTLFSH